jgi:hypothetical protein
MTIEAVIGKDRPDIPVEFHHFRKRLSPHP